MYFIIYLSYFQNKSETFPPSKYLELMLLSPNHRFGRMNWTLTPVAFPDISHLAKLIPTEKQFHSFELCCSVWILRFHQWLGVWVWFAFVFDLDYIKSVVNFQIYLYRNHACFCRSGNYPRMSFGYRMGFHSGILWISGLEWLVCLRLEKSCSFLVWNRSYLVIRSVSLNIYLSCCCRCSSHLNHLNNIWWYCYPF